MCLLYALFLLLLGLNYFFGGEYKLIVCKAKEYIPNNFLPAIIKVTYGYYPIGAVKYLCDTNT